MTDNIMDNECVMKIINHYKAEFKDNLRKALTPFMTELKVPLQIVINFGGT